MAVNIPANGFGYGGLPDNVWPSAMAKRKRKRAQIAVHIVGVLAYVVALGFGLVGAVIVLFFTSFSGNAPTTGDRLNLAFSLLSVAAFVTSVPAIIGLVARHLRTAALPWFALAALTAIYTIGVSLSTQPVPGPRGF